MIIFEFHLMIHIIFGQPSNVFVAVKVFELFFLYVVQCKHVTRPFPPCFIHQTRRLHNMQLSGLLVKMTA